MKRRARKAPDITRDIPEADIISFIGNPGKLLIIGAGSMTRQILEVIREYPEFEICGILDPDPSLRGKHIHETPILGWLANIPEHASHAVIGSSYSRESFDRMAVYYILLKRSIQLPIIKSKTSRIAPDIELRRASVILQDAVVETGAVLGENCLLGNSSRVLSGGEIIAHSVIMPHTTVKPSCGESPLAPAPKTLAATLATESDTLREIIRKINNSGMEIVLITNPEGVLTGTVTDGDIRRGLLAGLAMDQPVSTIMNRNPITLNAGTPRREMLAIMRNHSIRHLPVVDSSGRPVSIEVMASLVDTSGKHGAIVMAGGLGARLRPLTQTTPKPLLSVDGKPILDHILSGLRESGLNDVAISVNYMADQIKQHVKDGRSHNLNVSYINEHNRLGTAGALSLLQPRPKHPFLVMNGDLLTSVNYSKLIQFQQEHDFDIVLGVRIHETQIPYGVVQIRNGQITALQEKPVHRHFINAGIYVLKPHCIDRIPAGSYFDMTDLIKTIIKTGGRVGAFPVIEYWRDIGTPADLSAASGENASKDVTRNGGTVLSTTIAGAA